MFFILSFTVQKLFDFWVECSESFLLFSVRKVDGLISSRRDDVEFRIKNVNSMDNTVEARKCESHVTLVLPNGVLTAKIEESKHYQICKYFILSLGGKL